MTSSGHSVGARVEKALDNPAIRRNLDKALTTTNIKRDRTVEAIRDWESWRSEARCIKEEVLSHWHHYLTRFAERAADNGMKVHWALDAGEARETVLEISRSSSARLIVKSKSMLTEEIDLNDYLEGRGLQVVETDLGEFVAQIGHEKPSHIVAPIIHKSRSEVIDVYRDKLGAPVMETAEEITAFTRKLLREKFLKADIGITGANFGLAEEGAVAIVENEGNVRLCSSLPRVHIIVMGIERLIRSLRDLPLFLRLLTTSATGQSITNYVSIIGSPRRSNEKDGPREVHLILVDNGRTRIYRTPELREVLYCIRCGACLNVCPIYQRVGGHTYGWIYPGPIGSVLTPLLNEAREFQELPFLSTLCGHCSEVCPVRIGIEQLLVRLRSRAVENRQRDPLEGFMFRGFSRLGSNPAAYRSLEKILRPILRSMKKISGGSGIPRLPLPYPSVRSFHSRWKKWWGQMK